MTREDQYVLYQRALEEGLAYSQTHWPAASGARHRAYANTYAYALTGWAGKYGGPSLRERYACSFFSPPLSQEEARAVAARVHDELSREQLRALRRAGPTFDDDPSDLALLGEGGEA